MAWGSFTARFPYLLLILTFSHCQKISTNTPVPPLQWINLSNLLHGTAPPPLRDAAIGYDETSRSLLIFGGESSGGFVQSRTFLLNLDSLTWSVPLPPQNLQDAPTARSAAISGDDFAASYRHGHVVIGGKGAGGKPLSDVWEYDYISQFWAQVNVSPGGPSPRWGSSGGVDSRVPFAQGTPTPNNTFYLAGGFDGTNPISLSDLWEFQISGTLSSNLANSSVGSWVSRSIGKLPPKVNQTGTVLSNLVIAYGGCDTTTIANASCAQQDSYVLNTLSENDISPGPCPAPRLSASIVPNNNAFSGSFSSQVFLLLGTFDKSLWDDGGGLDKGEVAILGTDTGSWTRILPSGDPGTSGTPTFPSPRQGAAVLSYPSALVGGSRSQSSDTIVFGGQDANGNYLSDVWLLRSYNAVLTSSNQTWSNGNLESGINATGAGVNVQYITTCASAIAPDSLPMSSSSTSTSSHAASPAPTASIKPTPQRTFDTSVTHKLLAPLSVALFFPAIVLIRLGLPSVYSSTHPNHGIFFIYAAAIVGLAAYGVGIGGIATSFSSIASVSKRSATDTTLKTNHGRAGVAFFIALYGIIPLVYLTAKCVRYLYRSPTVVEKSENTEELIPRVNSSETGEKLGMGSAAMSTGYPSPPASPRPRYHSSGPSSWSDPRSQESSVDDVSDSSASPQRTFEVVNRPARNRRVSGQGLTIPGSESSHHQRYTSRPLGDLSWLERRRSLNAVGELDYALTQANRIQSPAMPGTPDVLSTRALMMKSIPDPQPEMPSPFDVILHLFFHALLLGLCILTLIALWTSTTSRVGFGLFLAWTVLFYLVLILLAWYDKPQKSILTVIVTRLRARPHPTETIPPATPSPRPLSSVGLDQYPFPADPRGPYMHQPPYRRTLSMGPDDMSNHHGGPRSTETDDDDDEEDDDTRQRRIEEEMGRREVSIITVPKRKLWITNPSLT